MRDYKIVKVQNSNELMGIEYTEGKLVFKVPQTFRIEDDESLNRQNLLLFVKSLNLSNAEQTQELKKSDEEGTGWPIDSYLWIIRDYLENGYYYNKEKKYSSNAKGKIEWKKTLKQMPIVSNGNVIYSKLVTSVTAPSNDLIAQIYKLCLKISQARIGWVFGYNIFVDDNITKSLVEMKRALLNEISSTFDDVKRLRFKHMMHILNCINEQDVSNVQFRYLINNYYFVFETMVDELFKGIDKEEWKKYNPYGNWFLVSCEKKEASSLEPDTVVKMNGKTYIIDAKMYKYGFTGRADDLPTTDSIQKQLTYGDHAAEICGDITRNAFVIPFDKNNNRLSLCNFQNIENDNLIYVGYSKGGWRQKNTDYDRIYTYLIDFNYLLNNYNTSETETINSLCADIEKRILGTKNNVVE